MLAVYKSVDGALVRCDAPAASNAAVWFDLLNPSREEDLLVERALSITVPTREEMAEIEVSSRLYVEGGAYYMTAIVLHQPDAQGEQPIATPVTFVLAGDHLVTVRYAEPRAFALFVGRAQKKDASCMTGAAVLVGLLEAIIDREADRVERTQVEVDKLSQTIFGMKRRDKTRKPSSPLELRKLPQMLFRGRDEDMTRTRRFDANIRSIGHEGELTSRSRESLLTLDRLLTFLAHAMSERGDEKALRARVKTAGRDVQSLSDHIGFLTTKITFLLDATLGMINNEQNSIIKIFSVLAVALMPPTLVGTVYGMNFKHIPELEWIWGYPFALLLMLLSAVLPYLYFKRKGWL
jgi:magnesium transporter